MSNIDKYNELKEVQILLQKVPGALNVLLKHNIINVIEKPIIGSQVTRLTDNVTREIEKLLK